MITETYNRKFQSHIFYFRSCNSFCFLVSKIHESFQSVHIKENFLINILSMSSSKHPPKSPKPISLETPKRKKVLLSDEIFLNPNDFSNVYVQEIENIKKDMPEFETLTEQVQYFKAELDNRFGKSSEVMKILAKCFPYRNRASLTFALNQRIDPRSSGRPSIITLEEKEMIKVIAYENFDKNNPLTIADLFALVQSKISSKLFNLQYFTRFIENNSEYFAIHETKIFQKPRLTVTQSQIPQYFENLKSAMQGISPKLIFNIDEIGFDDIQQTKRIFVVGKPNTEKMFIPRYPVPASVARITALVAIFLDGTTTPLIIVPIVTLQKNAFSYLEQPKPKKESSN